MSAAITAARKRLRDLEKYRDRLAAKHLTGDRWLDQRISAAQRDLDSLIADRAHKRTGFGFTQTSDLSRLPSSGMTGAPAASEGSGHP